MVQDYVGKCPIRKLKVPLALEALLALQEPSLPVGPLQVQAYLSDALDVLGAAGEGYLRPV
jgi:hypothetical protein